MRTIKYIVLHCTATPQNTTIESIQRYWRVNLGWKNPGYHFIIKPNGEAVQLLPIENIANGVAGYNTPSIHISYIGGVDAAGKPLDNRTPEQKQTQIALIKKFKQQFPNAVVRGHRDFPNVHKACPSFDVRTWLQSVGLCMLLAMFLTACGTKHKTVFKQIDVAEQIKNQRSETELKATSEMESQRVVKRDSAGKAKTTIYGAKGTFASDGSFTGSADSIKKENSSLKNELDSTKAKQKNDSAARAAVENQNKDLQGTVNELEEKIKEPPDPITSFWYTLFVGAAILLLSYLVYLIAAKRDVVKSFLTRIFNFFKRK